MAGLEQTLANVPGLGGFLGGEQNDQQRFAGDLQNVARLQQVFGAQQQQQEMGRIRQIIQQGGAPEQVIQALVGVGPTGAQMAQHYAGALKSQQEAAIRQKVLGGGSGMNLSDPDQLDALGASGIPGMAHFTARAERLRKAALDRQALTGMQGVDTPVARSTMPAGGSQEATDAALLAAYQKQGGGSVTAVPAGGDMAVDETRYAPTTKQGGAFASLMASSIPAIAQQAAELQRRVDAGQITAAQADVLHGRLVQQQASAEIGAGRQQTTIDNRRPDSPRVPVGYRLAADGSSIERIPVVGGTQASEDRLTDDAWYQILNGKARPGSVPIGRDEGNRYREQVGERISKIARELNMTPQQLATMGPENKSKFGALNAVEKDLAAIRPYDEMLNTNVKVAIDLAKNIQRTNSQFVNKPITWLMNNAGDNPDIAEYLFQIQTVKTEGARILNNPRLVGQLTDSARHEMAEVINGNMPLGQTERVLNRMMQDGKNRVQALERESEKLRSDIRGGTTRTSGDNSVESAVKAAGYAYEPDAYEYRVGIGGQVQRRKK